MMALAQVVAAVCLAIAPGSDAIHAGNLAPGFPALATIAPGTAIAPAPLPGVARVFHPAELQRIAVR